VSRSRKPSRLSEFTSEAVAQPSGIDQTPLSIALFNRQIPKPPRIANVVSKTLHAIHSPIGASGEAT
jgi:hypothetical protein